MVRYLFLKPSMLSSRTELMKSLVNGLQSDIADLQPGVVAQDILADSLKEMGLAEPDASVDEEGVVLGPGSLGCREGGGVGEAVGWSDDERVERVLVEQPGGGCRCVERRMTRSRARPAGGPPARAGVVVLVHR